MTQDIAGFGTVITLVADKTFPAGIAITQFADDADPLDLPSVKIGDTAMGVNGDQVSWSRATSVPLTLNVIAGSQDDVNLSILAANNRASQGKASVNDSITVSAIYPDGSTRILSRGRMTDAMLGKSISSAGRLKTKAYSFMFENTVGAG